MSTNVTRSEITTPFYARVVRTTLVLLVLFGIAWCSTAITPPYSSTLEDEAPRFPLRRQIASLHTPMSVISDEFLINTYTTNVQFLIRVSQLGSGFVSVWTSNGQDGDRFGVYCQIYDSFGDPIGGEFQVNSETDNSQNNPSASELVSGDFVVVWQSNNQDGSSSGVYGQRFSALGEKLGSEFQVNTYTDLNQLNAVVTGLSDGTFVVIWMSNGQDGDGYGIYGQTYDATGDTTGRAEFQVNTYTTSSQQSPDVLGMANGDILVVWMSNGQDGSRWGIYAQRLSNLGVKIGSEFLVNSYTSSSQLFPKVIQLQNDVSPMEGDIIVVWYGQGVGDTSNGIFAQQFTHNLSVVGTPFLVNNYTESAQIFPDLAPLSDGGFVVLWVSSLQDGSNWGIYGQRFDENANKVYEEFRVNQYTTNSQFKPSVATLKNGFVAAWYSFGGPVDTSSWGVYGRIYCLAGTNECWKCNGIGQGDANTVCNGIGNCVSSNNCDCTDSDVGDDCEPLCNGISAYNESVCNGSMICTAVDTCESSESSECENGYYGVNCENHDCNGLVFNHPHVCNGRGNCSSPNQCNCSNSVANKNGVWSGENCDFYIPSCFGVGQNDPAACASHGKCVLDDFCHCDREWGGPHCNISACFGVLSTANVVCSSHGNCLDDHMCNCTVGFDGPECENPFCFGLSASDANVCNGFYGSCILPDLCVCTLPDIWGGRACNITGCFGVLSTTRSVCSGHGNCLNNHTCECAVLFSGLECEIDDSQSGFVCFGIPASDDNVCSGHGSCVLSDLCVCHHIIWGGSTCNELNITLLANITGCFGDLNNTRRVPGGGSWGCGGHGNCEKKNDTQSESVVCSGHGTCLSNHMCECKGLYSGLACEIHNNRGNNQNPGTGAPWTSQNCTCIITRREIIAEENELTAEIASLKVVHENNTLKAKLKVQSLETEMEFMKLAYEDQTQFWMDQFAEVESLLIARRKRVEPSDGGSATVFSMSVLLMTVLFICIFMP